ncbi:hypothetical protein Fmac_005718 [Flemingia macrophylla]|uniref:Dof zinc finger protein n=1 Tax=Flemingia macrophylla TaxID=520843 RepID=A0ABD1N9Y0_9FABA
MAPPPDNMPPTPQVQEATQGPRNVRLQAPQQGPIKCPRCDSSNTKFCYYNNYSLSQPRHFCKTCRRYWTNGGSLRNVPIGGGCRKNKKPKPSSSSTSSASSRPSYEAMDFQFRNPSVEFHVDGLNFPSRNHHHPPPPPATTGVFSHFPSSSGDDSLNFGLDPPPAPASSPAMGLAPPMPNLWALGHSHSPTLPDPTLAYASSIESLSNMNEDMHIEMQQQRLAMMLGGESSQLQRGGGGDGVVSPILFHNFEISKPENNNNNNNIVPGGGPGKGGGAAETVAVTPTEWFFDIPFSSATTSLNVGNVNNGSGGIGNQNDVTNWGALHAWGNLQQPFNGLP